MHSGKRAWPFPIYSIGEHRESCFQVIISWVTCFWPTKKCKALTPYAGDIDTKVEKRLPCHDASLVDVFAFTTTLPRRIERHIRYTWILVLALWNLSFLFFFSVCRHYGLQARGSRCRHVCRTCSSTHKGSDSWPYHDATTSSGLGPWQIASKHSDKGNVTYIDK